MYTGLPILYSFRRCPYAMRARMAIAQAGISVELREVVLRAKPEHMLEISNKATVPVILLNDGTVIDESLDIMHWALSHSDTDQWLNNGSAKDMSALMEWNDGEFKYYLDRYKYADRYPEHDQLYYRKKAEVFLRDLEKRLVEHGFLCSEKRCLADMAIFPFIRQFAFADMNWFQSSKYTRLNHWLNQHINSDLFISIMAKYPTWQPDQEPLIFNPIK